MGLLSPRSARSRSGARRRLADRGLAIAGLALCGALVLLSWPAPRGAAKAPAASYTAAVLDPNVEVVLTSADLSQALTAMPEVPFSEAAPAAPAGPVIDIDEGVRDQRIKSMGGAMTDSSAWLIHQLGPSTRRRLMNALFGRSGIHLGFIRVPMGASDFTSGGKPWSYDDLRRGRSDPKLLRFSIRRDTRFTIPALQQALLGPAVRQLGSGPVVAARRSIARCSAPGIGRALEDDGHACAAVAARFERSNDPGTGIEHVGRKRNLRRRSERRREPGGRYHGRRHPAG